MRIRTIVAGTKVFFGAPAKPMPVERKNAIARAVGGVVGLREAHLPQCFIEGDGEARQILAIAVEKKDETSRVADEVVTKLRAVLPEDDFIDVIPFPSASFPPPIREAKCQILGNSERPWWKLW